MSVKDEFVNVEGCIVVVDGEVGDLARRKENIIS